MLEKCTIVEVVDTLRVIKHVDKIRRVRPDIKYGEAKEYCDKEGLDFASFIIDFCSQEQLTPEA